MKRAAFFIAIALALSFSALLAAQQQPNVASALVGTDAGLWSVDGRTPQRLGNLTDVRKIVHAGERWFFLSGSGIWTSVDLKIFEERDAGLPVKTIKVPGNAATGVAKSFVREIQELKDLAVHPENPSVLVTANKDGVWLTRDAGLSWKPLGLSAITSGVKAVAVLDLPDATGTPRLTVFMSHPIYGISWKQPDAANPVWVDLNEGLEKVPSIKWPDEVSSFALSRSEGALRFFAAQTFMPRVYELDWKAKAFRTVWKGSRPADTVEGLQAYPSGFAFTSPLSVRELATGSANDRPLDAIDATLTPFTGSRPAAASQVKTANHSAGYGEPECAWLPARLTGGRGDLSIGELWLLTAGTQIAAHTQKASLRKGMYVPVWQVTTPEGLSGHLTTLKDNGLDTMVIDMKDDFGTIRFDARDPVVLEKGVLGKGVELGSFVKTSKDNGIYLVARIVVFKDKALAKYGNAKYAVWDKESKKAWQGYELVTPQVEVAANAAEPAPATGSATAGGSGSAPTAGGTAASSETAITPPKPEKVRKYYEEYWVDPYSEDVWDYNVRIARELIERGFDEIQFDYIRFPTDGANLGSAFYRWQDTGMDKESALMSFLSYARKGIDAPISIDIYGANGWYRTGARTGQDVELLSRYVNAICPMFYPSHFEQIFLAQEPAIDRPWRIFYYGTYRNAIIARNKVVVRPWAQAFYLNVSYDRAWYDQNYVQRQIIGARDSINEGYCYWNNSGRYTDLRPDVPRGQPYPWQAPSETAIPAIPSLDPFAAARKN